MIISIPLINLLSIFLLGNFVLCGIFQFLKKFTRSTMFSSNAKMEYTYILIIYISLFFLYVLADLKWELVGHDTAQKAQADCVFFCFFSFLFIIYHFYALCKSVLFYTQKKNAINEKEKCGNIKKRFLKFVNSRENPIWLWFNFYMVTFFIYIITLLHIIYNNSVLYFML